MPKKILCLILASVFVLGVFSSCGKRKIEPPLVINGAETDAETFTYFLDKAFTGNIGADAQISAAVDLCLRYNAVNALFAAYGLALTDDETATATEEADTLWTMFGEYYKTEGVSKTAFVKIYIAGKYREKLRTAIYGKGGTEEIDDKYLRGALKEYFVAYKTITVPEYTKNVYGNRVEFTAEEIDVLRHVMSDGAGKLKSGQNIESVASQISVDYPLTEYSYSTVVYGPDSHGVTEEFIAAVKAMEEGQAGTVEMDGKIYIVYRIDILSDVNIFEANRDKCIELLSEQPLENLITAKKAELKAVKNTSAVKDCRRLVQSAKKKFY